MATQRIIDHIDTLRAKPEHIRHRIAMSVAFAFTGVVALGWMTAMVTSGTLALKSQSLAADTSETGSGVLDEPATAISSLMGAAGAAFGATSTDPELSIIDSKTSSTLDARAASPKATDKTVIPF
jgi:hypothetical protein